MNRLRYHALLALSVASLMTMTAVAQQPNSILQRTHSILVPVDSTPSGRSQALPKANLHRGFLAPQQRLPRTTRQARRFTPNIESILAPPAGSNSLPTQQIPARTYSFSDRPLSQTTPDQFNPSYQARSSVANSGYRTNPYATQQHAIRQVSGRDGTDGWPVQPEQPNSSIPDPFAQINVADFPEIGTPVPLDSTQDPEDQVRQAPSNARQLPAPVQQVPDTAQIQQSPESTPRQLPTIEQQEGQQETDPRPLPGDQTPPTQLPIPPRQDDSSKPETLNEDDGRKPFVYSNQAYPGHQSYPGPTASSANTQRPQKQTPTNPNQILYEPRERQVVQPTPQLYPSQPNYAYPYGQIDPASGLPIELAPARPSFGNYQQVVEPPYPVHPQSSFQKADGWRPQMAIGHNSVSNKSHEEPSFQPLFYLAAFGGLNSAEDIGGGSPAAGLTSATYNLDNGSNFGIALGQYQGKNLRTEFEYTFRHNNIESISLTENTGAGLSLTAFNLSGDVKSHSGMTNVLWQFSNRNGGWINPYIGAGVGFVFMDVNATRAGQNVLANGNDGNSSFAYQLFAGINTQLSSEMDVFVEYRYFAANELRLDTNLANVNGAAGFLPGDFNFDSHNINFGVRYKF